MNKDGKPFGYHNGKTRRLPKPGNNRVSKNAVVQGKAAELAQVSMPEQLSACAIVRDGNIHSYGFRSHAQIRSWLGDTDAYEQKHRPNDIEGFMTSKDRFVNRREGQLIAEESGQCQPMRRELLSSDILWWTGER